MNRWNRWFKSFRHYLEYLLFMLCMALSKALGLKQCESVANRIGDFFYDGLKVRRSIVERNLKGTFTDKSPEDIQTLAREIYRRQALHVIEVLRLPLIKSSKDASELLDIDGAEFLEKTKHAGKGGVIVSAHYGNWELLGLCTGLMVTPMNIVVKHLGNPHIDRWITATRTRHGNSVIYQERALRQGIQILSEGGILTVLGDQTDPTGSFKTDFLGRRSAVFLGPAFSALKARVPLFLGMCRRQENSRYIVEYQEIGTSDFSFCREDIEELTRRYTKAIGEYIYRFPEEWFWLHNRWKIPDQE